MIKFTKLGKRWVRMNKSQKGLKGELEWIKSQMYKRPHAASA